jgi:Uma2 family endonuclease
LMATKALITSEQYLAAHFEREPELVHGELMERPLPTFPHGDTQLELGSRLRAMAGSHGLFSGVEVRVRMADDLYRIPDIAVWEGPDPPQPIPLDPPLLVVEIISPDDRVHDIFQKLEEYRLWGVREIWLVEPELKKFCVYQEGLRIVRKLELPEYGFAITAEELFG